MDADHGEIGGAASLQRGGALDPALLLGGDTGLQTLRALRPFFTLAATFGIRLLTMSPRLRNRRCTRTVHSVFMERGY
jgi:hypothetical protein